VTPSQGVFSSLAPRLRTVKPATSLALVATFLLAAASPAEATLLSEWNVLVRTNMTTSNHVDGSTKVGGNLSASAGVFSMHLVSAPSGDGLAVGGNLSGNLQINNGGDLRIGGTNSASVTYNGGGVQINDPTVAASVASDFVVLDNLSAAYAALTPNGTLDGGGNLNAVPTLIDGQLVAVYNLTAGSITGLGQLNLNIGSANSVIINVTGGTVNFNAPPNLVGGFSQGNSARILWNLPNATQVNVNNNFNGALLAPGANLSLTGGGMNGTVAVNSISVQNAEIRRFNYTGYTPPVPEPSSVVLLGLAIAGFGYYGLRRRK